MMSSWQCNASTSLRSCWQPCDHRGPCRWSSLGGSPYPLADNSGDPSALDQTISPQSREDLVSGDVGWLKRRSQLLDEIQWGTFPFQPEAYVSLGTVILRFSPYWFRSTAIMTTITFVITTRSMTHPIRHQHTIICLIVISLRFIVL